MKPAAFLMAAAARADYVSGACPARAPTSRREKGVCPPAPNLTVRRSEMPRSSVRSAAGAVVIVLLFPIMLWAQGGFIRGTVTDTGARPLSSALVLVPAAGLSARTGDDGTFTVRGVPRGTYVLRVHRIGFKPRDVAGVSVSETSIPIVSVALEPSAVELGGMVVSASRRVEKITDAPATVTRLESAQIQNTTGNSFIPPLKAVNGIQFIQLGVTAAALTARAFNPPLTTRLLMIADGR